MKWLICSDTHDNLAHVEAMLDAERDADLLLHCGDIVSPFTLNYLAERFPKPIHLVWGNNDGDRWRLAQIAQRWPQITLHGEFAELTIGNRHIALVHDQAVGKKLFESGQYDLVCGGHNHHAAIERRGVRLFVNPGTLYGTLWPATYAVLDSERWRATVRELPIAGSGPA